MKAKELMIGDWVKFPIGNDRIIDLPYVEGKGICASFSASATLFPVPVSEIEPIPLTPEILEKNFTRTEVRVLSGTKTHYIESDDFYCVALNEYTDSIWELEYTNCEAHFPLARVLVAHVHELQNALRLIGIDKEIVI